MFARTDVALWEFWRAWGQTGGRSRGRGGSEMRRGGCLSAEKGETVADVLHGAVGGDRQAQRFTWQSVHDTQEGKGARDGG